MGKLSSTYKIPNTYDRASFHRIIDDMERQINTLSEGSIVARYTAQITMPTGGGLYMPGDFVPNSAVEELGTAGSKYVITGWVCVASPSTFVEARCLTGN